MKSFVEAVSLIFKTNEDFSGADDLISLEPLVLTHMQAYYLLNNFLNFPAGFCGHTRA